MKILISVILLTSLLFCTACEVAQSEPAVTPVTATASSNIEERLAKLEKIVEDMQEELGIESYWDISRKSLLQRVELLEEKVIASGFQEYLREPESLEARVKSLEDKVLTASSHGLQDKISKLERRLSELEQELGIQPSYWR